MCRENLLAQFISYCRAEKTGQWVLRDNEKNGNSGDKIFIHFNEFKSYSNKMKARYKNVLNSLESHPSVHLMSYETLCSTDNAFESLYKFIGAEKSKPPVLKIRKQGSINVLDKVENSKDLLSHSEFESISTLRVLTRRKINLGNNYAMLQDNWSP